MQLACHEYRQQGERCVDIEIWHPSKRINIIGALIDDEIVTVALFEFHINTAFNSWVEQHLLPKLTGIYVLYWTILPFTKAHFYLK